MGSHLPDDVKEHLRQHREKCAEKSRQISAAYGSAAAYRSTLQLEVIDRPDDAGLEEFHRLYRSIFTLEDESEPIEGFATVLGFNQDSRVQRDFGPFVEPILVLRDPADGTLVGAANFAIYAYPGMREAFAFDASCQLNFLLIREDVRGIGIAPVLMNYLESDIARFADKHCGAHRAFTTIEMNDPNRMTAEQINADAYAALIDPADRAAWWRKQGFGRLEFPYIQPPLSPEGEPCRYLDYYARISGDGSAAAALPSAVLHEHLRRFFTVSVGKFELDMSGDLSWQEIVQFISARSYITVDSRPL
jgi:GNAT superfamily N-acetyltransferase